jgi:hypothetical protein
MTDTVSTPSATKPMRFFTAADAPSLEADGIMSPPDIPGEVLRTMNLAPLVASGRTAVLFKDEQAGMSLVYARFLKGYRLPRHSHSADCLYYVVSGEAHIGGRVIGAGDGFFVRAGQPYTYTAGPDGIEILEFRGATSFDMRIFDRTVEKWEPIVQAAEDNHQDWLATWAAEDAEDDRVDDGTPRFPLASKGWFNAVRDALTALVAQQGQPGDMFSLCEVWADAPEGSIGRDDNGRSAWHVRITGNECVIEAGEVDDVTMKLVFDYAGALPYARSRTHEAKVPPAILEYAGDPSAMPSYFADLHDLMAPQTA